MNTTPRLNKEQYEQHSKRLKDEIEMYGRLMREKVGSPKEVQYLALRQKAALDTLKSVQGMYFKGGYNRMQNPGLQIEIPPVNEDALLQEPMNNNAMSVNSQATIVNHGMNVSNDEEELSVYGDEDVEMEGGRKRKHRHTKKCKCKKGKKATRKAKKQARKTKKARKAMKSRKAKKPSRVSRK